MTETSASYDGTLERTADGGVIRFERHLAYSVAAVWDAITNPERIASVLSVGDIELDRDSHRVTRNGRQVHLGPTEFRLLEFLMQSPGRVFSREQLLDGVWGRDVYIDERTVDVHVGRLRKALSPDGAVDPIRTVRGSGYSFDERYGK